jgi:hypothetical protein
MPFFRGKDSTNYFCLCKDKAFKVNKAAFALGVYSREKELFCRFFYYTVQSRVGIHVSHNGMEKQLCFPSTNLRLPDASAGLPQRHRLKLPGHCSA